MQSRCRAGSLEVDVVAYIGESVVGERSHVERSGMRWSGYGDGSERRG